MPATRPATPADHALFARFFAQLEVPDAIPSLEKWTTMCPNAFFVDDGGVAVAYGNGQKLGDTGYAYHVVVDQPARGRGYGRVVMRTLAQRFRADGCTTWCVNVKPDNTTAIRLYERCGMKRVYDSTVLEIAWSKLDAMPLVAADARLATPEEDAALERVFDLPAGRVAVTRLQPHRIVLRIDEAGAIAGVSAFDPTFPGAFPFRVARPELARALLEAMRAHKLPEHDAVRVVIENDDALTRALLDAGAAPVLAMMHMRGPIPAE